MKTYITNVYGMIKNKRIAKNQNRIAKVAHVLGYLELGIYNYPSESETDALLIKRIEGILSAVQDNDTVILQLPTGNGERFDAQLVKTIRLHKVQLIMLWHSFKYYMEQRTKLAIWSDYEVDVRTVREALNDRDDFLIQKVLLDACMNEKNIKSAEDIIHIGMGVHDRDGNYCSWLGITMQSIMEHTDAGIAFHILHDDTLTLENQRRLMYIASRAGNQTVFHKIENNRFYSQNSQMGMYTIGALFRILLPEVCADLSKIIYFDSDLLVNCDVRELWNMDISNYCLAAVPDWDIVEGRIWAAPIAKGQMKKERYFNSGVIYMNLEQIRAKGNMCDAVLKYIEKNTDTNLPDQDALNVIYQEDTLLLDAKWNRFAKDVRAQNEKELKECIYHYVGTLCVLYYETQMDVLYMQTAERTPWGNALSRKYINMSMGRQTGRIDNLRDTIHAICEGKRKILFYGQETWAMKNMYQLLSVTAQNSYRVLKEKEEGGILPCKDLSELQKEEKNTFIVLALPQADQGMALSNLDSMGLVRQKDYFAIPCLLKYEDGGFLA